MNTPRLVRLVIVCSAMLLCDVFAQPAPVPLMLLVPDEPPVMFNRYEPAGGPLQRFTSRPGAWYVTLNLASAPKWPTEFMVTLGDSRHELRVYALDTNFQGDVLGVHLLPMELSRTRHGQAHYTGEFVLPAHAGRYGVTLLLEQWSSHGDVPPPIWVHAKYFSGQSQSNNVTPWWGSLTTRPRGGSGAHPPNAPASPLLSQGMRRGPYEIPIRQMPVSPILDPYSAR